MPINATTHIQKMAPGPPAVRAMATPVRLPVPTRAASVVHSAWKEEMPALSLFQHREHVAEVAKLDKAGTQREVDAGAEQQINQH
ncbi:hypothetical protein SMQE31_00060 [Serratia marcescens]|nr:hypothetical protein SMQE31_00060 [Serratia marcescens]